jgi:hypothetical protein
MTNKAYVTAGFSTGASVAHSDNFSSLDSAYWNTFSWGSGVTESVSSGLSITATAGDVGSAGLVAKNSIDISNSYIAAAVAPFGAGADTNCQTGLALVGSSTPTFSLPSSVWTPPSFHAVEFFVEGTVYVAADALATTVGVVSYSSSWTYLRIRESAGNLLFGYSTDNFVWTEIWNIPTSDTALTLSAVYPALYAGNMTASGPSATATFASYATGLTVGEAVAEVSNLVVVNSSGVPTHWSGDGTVPASIYTPVGVSDSDQEIRENLADAIRTALSDSTLDVDFLV